MEKRIDLEKRGRPASQITELNLDNCRSTNIVGLTEEFVNLKSLSLINVGLTTLKGFPKLPNLKKLELSDNRISNGLNYLVISSSITHLNLSGNKLMDLDALKPLESFKHLEVLDLFNNEATISENYREKMFALIPSLKYLDGFDASDVEAPSEGEDEEDANGYGNSASDPYEDKNAFCINGLEIDLDELEQFEKRLTEKRFQNNTATGMEAGNSKLDEYDDLDEYLEKLNLNKDVNQCAPLNDQNDCNAIIENKLNFGSIQQPSQSATTTDKTISHVSFLSLLYAFLGILSLANLLYRSADSADDDDEVDDAEEEDEYDDVSLSEVYNDDLEEDNSDWNEENEDGEGEDDDIEEDDDEEESGVAEPKEDAAAAEEESPARGKKRKHDG